MDTFLLLEYCKCLLKLRRLTPIVQLGCVQKGLSSSDSMELRFLAPVH